MKMLKYMTLCVMLVLPCLVKAVCPTQETTVDFFNGVWTTKFDARKHTEKLSALVYAKGISPDCVHFTYSHTQDDGKAADMVEAIVQKSQETGEFSQYFLQLFHVYVATDPFLSILTNVFNLNHPDQIVATQLEKHLANYHTAIKSNAPEIGLRQRGIIVTHSQGGLYGNEVWGKLSVEEQTRTSIVTVATPSDHVAGGGENTRLSRDGVANLFFANALSATIPNSGLCENETEAKIDSWECHGFDTGYLHDVGARDKIVGNIIAQLPPLNNPAVHGTIVYQPRDSFSLYDENNKLFVAPYCNPLGTSAWSSCQNGNQTPFTVSDNTTLGSVQIAIQQQTLSDMVTVNICTTQSCETGTIIEKTSQTIPAQPYTVGTDANQPVFTFSGNAKLLKGVIYYMMVTNQNPGTIVYLYAPYDHSQKANTLFVVRS